VLLRAVNVGGGNKVPMKQWRDRLEALGLTDVETYLQSGQAVVRTRLGAAALARLVADDLREGLGVDTAVLVRTHAQLQRVVAGCPWPDVAEADPTKVHVAFVDEAPTSGWVVEDPDRYAPEQAVVGAGVVYLHLPQGAGRSRMPPSKVGTARNWRTVLRLVELTG
jgi:uncharacterized protein (DUF1697 family)